MGVLLTFHQECSSLPNVMMTVSTKPTCKPDRVSSRTRLRESRSPRRWEIPQPPLLRDIARFAEPVEPRGQRLLQGRQDRLQPPASPPSSRRRVTSSTNSGTPPVRSLTPSTTSLLSAWRAANSPTMSATSARSRGAQGNHAMVEAQAPQRSELGSHSRTK